MCGRWVKGLPGILLRAPVAGLFTGLLRRKGHADGFLVQIVMERYVPILCEVDELTSAMAGLTLRRAGTIALGAARCDFRFGIRGR